MRILLVEDEPNVVSVIKRGLAEFGYEISVAANGATGLQMALDHDFNLVILDVMLPVMDGIQVCGLIRQHKKTLPVMMLTALDSTENIVSGLDSGADDYLVKPFKIAELAARVRTLLRRNGNDVQFKNNSVFTIADLELNAESKIAYRSREALKLTATEYRLLEYFVRNQKKVLSRIQILESVWDIDFNMGTNVVDVYVNYLRKKLEKNGGQKLIHTVFGMGYMMKEEEPDENTK